MSKKYFHTIISIIFISLLWSFLGGLFIVHAAEESKYVGGGYAATGQIDGIGYSCIKYDSSNGFDSLDVNYLMSDHSGYMWVGTYGGVYRYDGLEFEMMESEDGFTSGRVLYEDSKNRIWVGTNGDGVVMGDGKEIKHYSYTDGLLSSSIRSFAEGSDGYMYIGTTDGICYADEEFKVLNDARVNDERVLRMISGADGCVYACTKNGAILKISEGVLAQCYQAFDLELESVSTIYVDKMVCLAMR